MYNTACKGYLQQCDQKKNVLFASSAQHVSSQKRDNEGAAGKPPKSGQRPSSFARRQTQSQRPDASAQGDDVSPCASMRGAVASTNQSAETVRSETSLSFPDVRSRSPALWQNCGGVIERFTGHDNIALIGGSHSHYRSPLDAHG